MTTVFLLAIGVGLLNGLLLGLVGGGGSILAVPALVYLLGQKVGPATTISLVVVGLNAGYGAFRYWREGGKGFNNGKVQFVRVDYALALGVTGLIGAQAGNWLNRNLPDRLLLGSFAVLMLLVAGLMLRPPKLNTVDIDVEKREAKLGDNWLKLALAGLSLGFLTGLFGVGGGFLVVPVLVLLFGFGMRMAAATSLLVIALNSLSALVGRWPFTGLDAGLIIELVASGIVGTTIGKKFANILPDKTLRRVFAWIIVATSFYIGYRALT